MRGVTDQLRHSEIDLSIKIQKMFTYKCVDLIDQS